MCSPPAYDVGTHHVNTVVSQLVADLSARTLIKLSILSMTTTAIDGCREARQLFIALTGISRTQLMTSIFFAAMPSPVPAHQMKVAAPGRT